jgi:hypothetical protein
MHCPLYLSAREGSIYARCSQEGGGFDNDELRVRAGSGAARRLPQGLISGVVVNEWLECGSKKMRARTGVVV